MQLQPLGIGVSVACPGFVRTRIMEAERNRPTRYEKTAIAENASFGRLSQLVQSGNSRRSGMGEWLIADVSFLRVHLQVWMLLVLGILLFWFIVVWATRSVR
jgi:hypothetical protein